MRQDTGGLLHPVRRSRRRGCGRQGFFPALRYRFRREGCGGCNGAVGGRS